MPLNLNVFTAFPCLFFFILSALTLHFVLPLSLYSNSSFLIFSLHNYRQIKIQSTKLPQYIQITYDKITTPIIVSNRLFSHTPPFAVRMRIALFICIKFLGWEDLTLVCSKQRVNDSVQIHFHSASTLRIKATFRWNDIIHWQRQPRRICCRVICFNVQYCRIIIRRTMENDLSTCLYQSFKSTALP